ncbi:MAG TPA: BTAD domain-containing putative transcriptional regulator, partial [Thermoanaerobaculia bacterium]
ALLWPESGQEAARHALRQAVYSLRSLFPAGDEAPPLLADHREVRFNPAGEHWLDAAAFEEALRRGAAHADPHRLAAAAQLYRGDFLSGFHVKEALAFEEWLFREQERLREAAVGALRTLVESYRRRGEVRFASHYARRLLAIDPLSEPTHRELMRLAAAAGHRSRALAQYDELCERLLAELGVEPMEETRALYESILAEPETGAAPVVEGEAVGPLVPLVGREGPLAALAATWREVQAGAARWTLVEGETGVGKSRLIKTGLDAALAQGSALVLQGRGCELRPPPPLLPVAEALRSVLAADGDGAERLVEQPPAALAELCAGLARQSGRPLVLLLDDLHLADPGTFELLGRLAAGEGDWPVWIVTAWCPEQVPEDDPRRALVRRWAAPLWLDRLAPAGFEEIAAALVTEGEAAELGAWLAAGAAGLPLLATELINLLRDEGVLVSGNLMGWRLARPLAAVAPPPADVRAVVLRRIRALPQSTRRLATLASVIGRGFEFGLLQAAGGEHPTVVEVGLELLLQRWLVRRASGRWTDEGRAVGEALWATGARRGDFEFAHRVIGEAIFDAVDPKRRRVLHGAVAAALEERSAGDPRRGCEAVAHHWLAAGRPEKAVPCLRLAAERSRALGAVETAAAYEALAAEAASAISSSARATPAASPTSTRR